MPDLLLELLSEEIPARMQPRAAEDLRRLVTDGLVERGLTYAAAAVFATPRRLVLALEGLPAVTPDTVEERRGPRVDAPEKALEGFLRSIGLARDDLEAREDRKGAVWFARVRRPGRPAAEVIAEVVAEVIRAFPWPKSMRWGDGALRWVRPLHSILCILSDEAGARVVPVEVDGIAAGDSTVGHRFMAPERFAVTGFEDYAAKLKAAHVLLDPAERAERIWHDTGQQAFARGLEPVGDRGLLAEVAGLVEWPVVLVGTIAERFLDLPAEVLQTSMKTHQKFFSLRNPATGRIEAFATVANIAAPDGGRAILAGNARVLAARLADAAFFWQNDLRVATGPGGLAAMAEPLKAVTFHNKLGTQWERIERIAALAREIAPHVGADPEAAERAARLAKADLASAMVYEFPELQGTMGRYYARAAGEPPEIAAAAEGHYRPLGPSDAVPAEPVTVAVALADKIDLLTGMWAIDEKPTGSKDPFALRRAAVGAIRLVLENGWRLHFAALLDEAYFLKADGWIEQKVPAAYALREDVRIVGDKYILYGNTIMRREDLRKERPEIVLLMRDNTIRLYGPKPDIDHRHLLVADVEAELLGVDHVVPSLLAFLADRLKVHLRDEGIRHDVIQACFELGGQDDLVALVALVRAVQAFLGSEDGEHLLTAYRRANNIIRQARADTPDVAVEGAPDPALLRQPQERALFETIAALEADVEADLRAEEFERAMRALAHLRAPVDAFFDEVTVNVDDPRLRENRLRLLNRIRAVMRRVAVWDAIEG